MSGVAMSASTPHVHWFEEVGHHDVVEVGGKNASLGEMVANLGRKGVRVPVAFSACSPPPAAIVAEHKGKRDEPP